MLVFDASCDCWLVHAGSTLGIVPTTVRFTLGILQNMWTTCVKYWKGSISKLDRDRRAKVPGKAGRRGVTEDKRMWVKDEKNLLMVSWG